MFADQAPCVTPAQQAERASQTLVALLARYNIPADAHPLSGGEVAVSVYYGLIARTDGAVFWWTTPTLSQRGGPLLTYATTPATAAARLAEHYMIQRGKLAADLLRGPLLSDLLMPEGGHAPM
ncbi:hypothetical protein ABT352_32950 [Streptosporangium sp. NPDC000563]|uniref:hypothetical protein n=1 Tax=Streptosporangium sp. NPDC000563 TaxID=3154366 RepID=UPI00332F24F9